jgi:hypothetical protein
MFERHRSSSGSVIAPRSRVELDPVSERQWETYYGLYTGEPIARPPTAVIGWTGLWPYQTFYSMVWNGKAEFLGEDTYSANLLLYRLFNDF